MKSVLLKTFAWSLVAGSVLCLAGWLLTMPGNPGPRDTLIMGREPPDPVFNNESPEATAARMRRLAEQRMTERLNGLSTTQQSDQHSSRPLSQWTEDRWRIVEQIHDPSRREAVLGELQFLRDRAYLPGTEGASASPLAELIEHVFRAWAAQDPPAAAALEKKFARIPASSRDDWAAFNGVYIIWMEMNPQVALEALVDRLREPADQTINAPLGAILGSYPQTDPVGLLQGTRQLPGTSSFITSLAEIIDMSWRRHRPEEFDEWARSHPEHPILADERFNDKNGAGAKDP